jgi:hypothetical protein
MPPKKVVKDPAWDYVILTYRLHNNPDTECIYCGFLQTTNAPSRLIKHLKKCPYLPASLYSKYQPNKLRGLADFGDLVDPVPSLPRGNKRRGNGDINSYIDTIDDDMKEELDQACAEWIYGSGLPLSTVG